MVRPLRNLGLHLFVNVSVALEAGVSLLSGAFTMKVQLQLVASIGAALMRKLTSLQICNEYVCEGCLG